MVEVVYITLLGCKTEYMVPVKSTLELFRLKDKLTSPTAYLRAYKIDNEGKATERIFINTSSIAFITGACLETVFDS